MSRSFLHGMAKTFLQHLGEAIPGCDDIHIFPMYFLSLWTMLQHEREQVIEKFQDKESVIVPVYLGEDRDAMRTSTNYQDWFLLHIRKEARGLVVRQLIFKDERVSELMLAEKKTSKEIKKHLKNHLGNPYLSDEKKSYALTLFLVFTERIPTKNLMDAFGCEGDYSDYQMEVEFSEAISAPGFIREFIKFAGLPADAVAETFATVEAVFCS